MGRRLKRAESVDDQVGRTYVRVELLTQMRGERPRVEVER
jgi:hypothetical protein